MAHGLAVGGRNCGGAAEVDFGIGGFRCGSRAFTADPFGSRMAEVGFGSGEIELSLPLSLLPALVSL